MALVEIRLSHVSARGQIPPPAEAVDHDLGRVDSVELAVVKRLLLGRVQQLRSLLGPP